jgi:hypothetical protein
MAAGNEVIVQLLYQSAKQLKADISGQINNGTFFILDGSGRKLKSYKINTSDAGTVLDIDLSASSPGLYLYHLVAENGVVNNGKIIIR